MNYLTTRCHIPEETTLHSHRCDILKSKVTALSDYKGREYSFAYLIRNIQEILGSSFWLGSFSSQKLFIKNNIWLRRCEQTVTVTSNMSVSHHNTFVCVFCQMTEHIFVSAHVFSLGCFHRQNNLHIDLLGCHGSVPGNSAMNEYPLPRLENDPGNPNSIRGQMPPVAEPTPFLSDASFKGSFVSWGNTHIGSQTSYSPGGYRTEINWAELASSPEGPLNS